MKVLVTGASGFVGCALCDDLIAAGLAVRGAVRASSAIANPNVEYVVSGEISGSTDWSTVLNGIDAVVHLAARVHVMHDVAHDPLQAFREVNTAGTECLAKAAINAGVRVFVYVSTVKVHGESTTIPARESDVLHPVDPYAISKFEAEEALHRLAIGTVMKIAIIRPPLVYGPGVGANFLRLLRLVERGIPLPFLAIHNRRSLVFVGNLTDALVNCVVKQINGTYLISDGESMSTPDLMRAIGNALGCSTRLFYFPATILRIVGKLTGKADEVERLIGSLEVDASKLRNELQWRPPFSLEAGLAKTVKWFKTKY